MLNELQVKKLTHFFNLHDADHDGFVELSDYERLIARVEARRGPDAALRALWMKQWKAVSTGQIPANSGRIPIQGWLALWNAILQISFRPRVGTLTEHLFRTMDVDGDGRIILEEVRAWLELFGQDPAYAEIVFQRCDLNQDGHISAQEWNILIDQFFYSDNPDDPGNFLFGPIDLD